MGSFSLTMMFHAMTDTTAPVSTSALTEFPDSSVMAENTRCRCLTVVESMCRRSCVSIMLMSLFSDLPFVMLCVSSRRDANSDVTESNVLCGVMVRE